MNSTSSALTGERSSELHRPPPSEDETIRRLWKARWRILGWVTLLGVAAIGAWQWWRASTVEAPLAFASGNGRIEAIEVDIAAKAPGRIDSILVDEGDPVAVGQVLATMDTATLQAQLAQAEAQLRQAEDAALTASAVVKQRENERAASRAVLAQRQADRDLSAKRWTRSANLLKQRAVSQQSNEQAEAEYRSTEAAVIAATAQIAAADAAVVAAKAQVTQAHSAVEAARATVAQVHTTIEDSTLRSPRDGRVQYRVAQPGEVLGAGGKVLNIVDLTDVTMSFFLPETVAGRVAIGSEVRLVLDAAPTYVFPARVSYVASVAQFTPKTVETQSERQKLMFRVKARLDPQLLKSYANRVKTGLPGVAHVKLDDTARWSPELEVKLP
nr:HlyD family efflux transporter periplasmic adaptor subunit [Peristeroidobacter soli]